MNDKFLQVLENVELNEKVTLETLQQTCNDIIEQNKAINLNLARFKDLKLNINESDRNLFFNLKNSINNIKIPDQITIENRSTIDIKDKTRKFLLIYFLSSFLVVIMSLSTAFYCYQYKYVPQKQIELSAKQQEWAVDYIKHVAKKYPKVHKECVRRKPLP